jgi:RHS repeat-associated protein
VSYTYNADGTLASKLDANGNTETYTYDAYQRLTAIPTRQQTFTYDTCPTTNNTGCSNAAGQLMQATFGSASSAIGPNYLSFEYNYAYTPAGKVSTKTLQLQSGNHLNVDNVPASGTVAANYTYDSQGALTQMSYAPGIYGSGTAVFSYTLDAMERPTAMTTGNYSWASGVTYNAANQMTYDGTQTRTYNSLMQTTQVGNMTYNYSPNKNNGQIVSSVEALTAETITYQYDALKRLLSASGKNWGETYAYDGWGNLLQMNPTGTAGAPSLSVTVGATTNRVTSPDIEYDNNGNLTLGFAGMSMGYDTANRMTEVATSAGDYYYAYDSDNRRIYYRDNNNNETIYFYGADGRKLSSYTMTFISNPNSIQMNPAPAGGNVYFAGILLMEEGNSVRTDRLGSVRWGGPNSLGYQAQYPYGVEYTTTANGREKYATYTRDSDSGMDYAMNRYYSSQWGRFLSPDRRWRSAKPDKPQSWNRYTYVLGDPTNLTDPSGLYYCASPGLYNLCPVAYGIMDSGTGDILSGDDGDDGGDGGGGCPDPSGGNNFDPTPEPPGPNPCPPPPAPPAANCDISVAYSGTPRDGQSAVGLPYPYAPPTNQLGPYMNNGWFLYVQVQADLTGDTNGSDWFSSQSASTFGTVRPSPGAPAQVLRQIQPDDAPYSTVIYSGNGTYDWLDTPGLGKGIYSASLTFSFASTLINTNTRASCSVDWSFQLSVLGNKWSISNIMENSF